MTTEKTTSWTPGQQAWVDEWVLEMADALTNQIPEKARRLKAMDKRPKQTWSEEKPNVFFEYVEQALLEDLIAELESRV